MSSQSILSSPNTTTVASGGSNSSKACHGVVDVAVIGAGFAGLSCAGRLLNAFPEQIYGPSPFAASHPNLTVAILEARDRVGGRAFSLPLQPSPATLATTASSPASAHDVASSVFEEEDGLGGGCVARPSSRPASRSQSTSSLGISDMQQQQPSSRFDLGASWLHESCADNPFTSLIRTFKASTVLHDDLTPDVLFDGVEGTRLSRDEIMTAKASANTILEDAKSARPKEGEADRPLSHDVTMPSSMTGTEVRAANWFLHETEQLLATSFDVLSGAHWDDYAATCMDGPDEFVVDSIGVVVERLAGYVTASPRATLHLKAVVSDIRRVTDGSGDKVIEIVCADGRTLLARKVVCTIPLGVLKTGSVAFTPALTPRKQEAIKNLGVGVMNKVILEYDSCFWNEEDLVFGHTSDKWGEFPWFINLKKETKRNVLICFLVGKAAVEVEGWADDKIIHNVHSILQAMFPGKSSLVDGPKSYLITRWASDPFSRGSYAMYQVGSSAKDCKEFEVPEWDSTLYFAGEHMSWNEQGFVHGAIITGLQAADAILKC